MADTKPKTQTIALTDPKLLKDKKPCPMSGSKNDNFGNVLANQMVSTLRLSPYSAQDQEHLKQSALVGMMGAAPRDEIEGMLAAQMVAAQQRYNRML